MSTDLEVVTVVHPSTGEVVDLAAAATTDVADLLFSLRTRKAEIVEWEKAAKAEVVKRLAASGRKQATVGSWFMEAKAGRSREWDPDDLEATLHDLVTDGVVSAAECVGIVTLETKVNGTKARDLLDRLDGDPRKAVEACAAWKQGTPTVTVAEVTETEAEAA